jgi:hypothetical protein
MKTELGIELPSFADEYNDASDVRATAAAYKLHTSELAQRIRLEDVETFDALLMKTETEPVHIALCSGIGYGWQRTMLHMRPEFGPANVPIKSVSTEYFITGAYRWTALRSFRDRSGKMTNPLPMR